MEIKWNKIEETYVELNNESTVDVADSLLPTKILEAICKHYTNHNDSFTKYRIYIALKQMNTNKEKKIPINSFFTSFHDIFNLVTRDEYIKSQKN